MPTVLSVAGDLQGAVDKSSVGSCHRDSVRVPLWQTDFEEYVGIGWREELPDPVEVPLEEVSTAISELDRLLHVAEAGGHAEIAQALDAIVGRMTRWVWPLLNELDEGYDD